MGVEEAAERVRRRDLPDAKLLAATEARHGIDCSREDLEVLDRLGGRLVTPHDEEWPVIAIEASKRYEDTGLITGAHVGWSVKIYDSYVVHRLTCEGDGTEEKQWTYLDYEEHGMPVPPVARCANWIDLDGRTRGAIEPILPLLRRIDQDTFDRLINQRFGAWQVRYIAGMAKPDGADEQRAQALKLSITDLLVSTDSQTKFGTLPGADPSLDAGLERHGPR